MGIFHKMEVWKESKDLAVRIYYLTNKDNFIKDYSLKTK